MICGNRNAGKRVATVTIAVLLILILITAVVAFRKRTAPATEPPLVPQMIVVTKEQPSSLPPLLPDFGAPPRPKREYMLRLLHEPWLIEVSIYDIFLM
jgi:hypothetical protein